jgi:hypothetical protein
MSLGVPEAHLCYETHGSGPLMVMVKEPHKVRRMGTHMANDVRDNPGIRAPSPLIYLLPLVAGLLLDRRRSHVAFLPRGVSPSIEWPLIGGWLLVLEWFLRTMRNADAPTSPCRG